jgi:hypothetical protein
MPKFNIVAKVTGRDGATREVTGTVGNDSPLYGHDRARNDAANQLGKNIASGETVDANNIQVRYGYSGQS